MPFCLSSMNRVFVLYNIIHQNSVMYTEIKESTENEINKARHILAWTVRLFRNINWKLGLYTGSKWTIFFLQCFFQWGCCSVIFIKVTVYAEYTFNEVFFQKIFLSTVITGAFKRKICKKMKRIHQTCTKEIQELAWLGGKGAFPMRPVGASKK